MLADVEILTLPYDVPAGRSLLHRLIEELGNPDWTLFRAAVAFARSSGNYMELLDALRQFAERGGRVELTFGADTFSGEQQGSDYEAIAGLLNVLDTHETADVHLYHERGRTFHPKIYLFANQETQRALVIIGSSNWSEGGLVRNVEVDVLLHLDLGNADQLACFDRMNELFDLYWREQ